MTRTSRRRRLVLITAYLACAVGTCWLSLAAADAVWLAALPSPAYGISGAALLFAGAVVVLGIDRDA